MNTAIGDIVDIHYILAALCSFCLLCSRRAGLSIPSAESHVAFAQGAFLIHGRAFSAGFSTPKSVLPRGTGANIRLDRLRRGFDTGLVVSAPLLRQDRDLLFRPRHSSVGNAPSPDHNLP